MQNPSPDGPGPRRWVNANVLRLGLVSLLNDAASEMIVPLLPLFLTVTLGAGALTLGWMEGLAELVSSLLKLWVGQLSDRLDRRRPFILGGYSLATLARPLVGLAGGPFQVLGLRVLDRAGKGVRTSPRDALLAASTPAGQRGRAFSLHRAMDHTGAVVGPLLAVLVLHLLHADSQVAQAGRGLRAVFLWAAVPGLAAVMVAYTVREIRVVELASPDEPSRSSSTPRLLWRFLVPLGLFTLGNASDMFLLLKAGASRAPLISLPLLWMGLHVVKILFSIPGGQLADRLGPRRTIAGGWCVYAAVYAGLAFAESPRSIALLFLAYGAYHGLTEGPEKSLVASLAPRRQTGTAFGWYHLTLGGLALAASVLFGGLWQHFGSRAAFLTGASLALAAALALALLAPRGRGWSAAGSEMHEAGAQKGVEDGPR